MVKPGKRAGAAAAKKGKRMRTEMQGGGGGGGARLDPRIQTEIGKHLRAVYDDVINEPVPSKFMELLEKLERSTQKS
jgi:Anti-sigma factor NepR